MRHGKGGYKVLKQENVMLSMMRKRGTSLRKDKINAESNELHKFCVSNMCLKSFLRFNLCLRKIG